MLQRYVFHLRAGTLLANISFISSTDIKELLASSSPKGVALIDGDNTFECSSSGLADIKPYEQGR